MRKRNIYVDMDGTLVKWRTDVSFRDVCAPGYFRSLPSHDKVCEAIKILQRSYSDIYEVRILTSTLQDDHSKGDKSHWLDRHFDIPESSRFYVPYGESKSEYLKEHAETFDDDVLLDDYSINLRSWHGVGVKMFTDINGNHGSWTGFNIRYNMIPEIMVKQFIGCIEK